MSERSSFDPDYFPDNLPECHRVISELRAEVKRLQALEAIVEELRKKVANLETQVKNQKRARFGRSSAQVSTASLTGTGKVYYEESSALLEEKSAALSIAPEEKSRGGGRTAPQSAIAEKVIEHELSQEERLCPDCSIKRGVIGFEVSCQLDIIKAMLQRLKHIQFRYACPGCNSNVILAPKPDGPIEKGYATAALISYIGVSKFDYHQPLYRQEKFFRSYTVPVSRSSMCRWLKSAADIFEIVVERMRQLILNSRVIQADHTTMPMLKKGKGKVHQSYIWIYRGDDSQPYIYYDFTETQQAIHPKSRLKGFTGVLQTDCASYFLAVDAIHAGCWSHAFRYMEAARDEDQERVDYALAIIKCLFDIEDKAREATDEDRRNLRQELAIPKLDLLKSWLDARKREVDFLPASNFGKAVGYCLNNWDALCLYASTGFVAAHNNNSENGLRSAVLGKKNWLFAGSVDGGRSAAIWMSIIQTCHRIGIDPMEYAEDLLNRLPATPTSQIDQFLPDRWKAARQDE
ncbi:MAG: IS66 family transposase [Candidatus Melainabacteria bacterium]|nr:IS66 family transposase [Candidatus Melainabacteria bacterium]